MKMRSLLAIKPHKYGTRHLIAGDEYEAPPRQAVALVAGRKARFAHKPPARAVKAKAEVAEVTAAAHEPIDLPAGHDIDQLRTQAAQFGISVDGRWGVARLQYEISRARR